MLDPATAAGLAVEQNEKAKSSRPSVDSIDRYDPVAKIDTVTCLGARHWRDEGLECLC